MNEELTVRIIRSFDEIEEIRRVWVSWEDHPNSDIDFYLSRFRLRPEYLRPHVLVVCRDGQPDAMLLGRLDHARILDFKVGYWRFFAPWARVLSFLHGGFLGNATPQNSEAMITAILDSLRRGEADVAALNNIEADSALFHYATSYPSIWTRDRFPTFAPHYHMTLPGSIQELYGRLSPKVRKNQRWQAKKLLSDFPGQVRVHCFRRPDELNQMFRDVETVAKKTYQRGLGVGFIDNAETQRRLAEEANRGGLRAYVLYINERPCAFQVTILCRGTLHLHYVGYDPAYAKYSPGMFLMMKIVEDLSLEDGKVKTFDFGYGSERYKQLLGNCRSEEALVYIFAPTFKGLRLNAARAQATLLDRLVRRTLEKTNLLPKLKKLWRAHVAEGSQDD